VIQLRVILNGAKATGERLNDPIFETMKSANITKQNISMMAINNSLGPKI